jgi:transcriptional antiterminator Rof (Rho-off)
MSRGVLMYAHNNPEIDYLRIACANALMVKKNLKVPVTLVTDANTLAWAEKSLDKDFLNNCFDKIIEVEFNGSFKNKRNFGDTSFNTKSLQFYNCNHWEAYELTP